MKRMIDAEEAKKAFRQIICPSTISIEGACSIIDALMIDISNEGCICDRCKNKFKVDLNVSDELWERISGKNDGSGLLCPHCILDSLEINGYGSFELKEL